jgi:hypothetical protein
MMRALNIALRTTHIAAMGVLVGGHAFDVSPERLTVSLWLAIGTGVALVAVEAGPRLLWFHQARGVMTLVKLALICAVPLAWDYRLPILITVIVIASIASHMPGRMRHYSVVYRRVIHDMNGSGGKRAGEDAVEIGARR